MMFVVLPWIRFNEGDAVSPEEVVPELPKLGGDLQDSLASEDLFRPLSDMERDLDKTSRLQVLLRLLQLACAMVRHPYVFQPFFAT